jgi:endonuclease YncB( thermonuclease family)
MRRLIAFALFVVLLSWPASAEMPARLAPGGGAVVREVVDGDTVVLADGRQVRLVGIQAPKLPLGRVGFPTWPLAEEAKAALESLALGRRVSLGYGGRRTDRNGRALAHLYDAEGRWLQGELIGAGFARVYSFADNTALVAEMLALERAARAERRGIWADPFYKVREVTETPQLIGTFQLVEGRVLRVNVFKGRTYLYFGPDFGRDFVAVIVPPGDDSFARARLVPQELAGRKLRVRGWIKGQSAPRIEINHPEQIEVLNE